MKKLFCFISGFILFLVVVLFIFPGCGGKKINFTTYYNPNGVQKGFTIALDSIGLVKRVPVNLDSFKKRLEHQGYKVKRSVSDEIFIIIPNTKDSNKVFTQERIIKIVKGLVNINKDIIETGGMVVYPDSSKIPYLINDEIIVQFKPSVAQQQKENYFNQHGLTIVQQNGYRPQQYLVIPSHPDFTDIFKFIRKITDTSLIKFVTPNFIVPVFPLTDDGPITDLQWHIANRGTGGGIEDADCDADLAWDFTKGNRETKIAIIDFGFEIDHPALQANWAINTAEQEGTPGNDDNPHPDGRPNEIDDIIGWNFHDCDGNNTPGCGNTRLDLIGHGTAVAGIIAANVTDNRGTTGICPGCSIIPIEKGTGEYAMARAFDYAVERGAKIISCSFKRLGDFPIVNQAIGDAFNAGVILFIAADNENKNRCNPPGDIESDLASLDDWVVAVSRSSNLDRFDNSGFGKCIDLLAPSYYQKQTGTLGVVTTDLRKGSEIGNDCPVALPIDYPGYTSCFSGTSAAAPLVAGIAGLILSVDPTLRPKQIQNLLQDCADKIEDSKGKYSPLNGYSNYGTGSPATHGFGRVNAYEAVKIASPDLTKGGRNGVDIFLRDNDLDWGNTEQPSNTLFERNPRGFIPHWNSPDVKVDAPDINNRFVNPNNSSEFEAFRDQSPIGNKTNRVYVRVRNRGYRTTTSEVSVKLYWVYAGTMLPTLWPTFPHDIIGDPTWHFLGTQTIPSLAYSGSSIAGTADDPAQIVTFRFDAPMPDPSLLNHYCLLAMVSCDEDPLLTNGNTNLDMVTPYFNNITHRNYSIETSESPALRTLYLNNPYNYSVQTKVSLINPQKILVKLGTTPIDTFFTLASREKRLIKFTINNSEIKYPTELTIQQEIILNDKKKRRVVGGFTYYFSK